MNRILLRGGTIVSLDPEHPEEFVGDILVEDSRIAAIAPVVEVDEASCEVLDVRGHIVCPGMADTHRHMWQSIFRYAGVDWVLIDYANAMWRTLGPAFEPEDTYLSVKLGLLEALDAGVTQVYDWNHNVNSPEHADAIVAAHRDSGARVVFGYGQSSPVWAELLDPAIGSSASMPNPDIHRVASQYYSSSDQRLTLGLAARGPECSPMDVVVAEAKLATELNLRSSVHVGNGTWGNLGPVKMMIDAGCPGDTVTWIHCNSLADSELDLIRDTGGSISTAPELESHMGHGRPVVERAMARGIRPALSVDTCVNVSGDLFSIMRAALSSMRGDVHARAVESGSDSMAVSLRAGDVLDFATVRGAESNGLGRITGTLSVGKQADIITINTAAPNLIPVNYAVGSIVMGAHPGNVDTVLVAGDIAKRDGKLVDVDLRALMNQASDARDRLFEAVGGHTGGWMPSRTERNWQDTPQ